MERTDKIKKKIKNTHIGNAMAWLCKPKAHYNAIKYNLEKQLPYAPTKKQILWCFWDYFLFRLFYMGNLETDYFGAQMYRKSNFVRSESLANNIRFSWRDRIQEREQWDIFLDKRLFNEAFSEHLHRKWLTFDKKTTWMEFESFVIDSSYKVFVKKPISNGGKDVEFFLLESMDSCKELFNLCYENNLLVEEMLVQCDEIYEFSNSGINTVRIITIVDLSGGIHIARCELRLSRSDSYIDNYSSGGLVAQVDIATGIIYSMARDANGGEYIFHPDTGKQIVGFKIPEWEKYKEFAYNLANRFPKMQYVGWDIIKDSKGNFCVIEGNKDAGVGGLESGLLYGLKPSFDAMIKGEKQIPYYR